MAYGFYVPCWAGCVATLTKYSVAIDVGRRYVRRDQARRDTYLGKALGVGAVVLVISVFRVPLALGRHRASSA